MDPLIELEDELNLKASNTNTSWWKSKMGFIVTMAVLGVVTVVGGYLVFSGSAGDDEPPALQVRQQEPPSTYQGLMKKDFSVATSDLDENCNPIRENKGFVGYDKSDFDALNSWISDAGNTNYTENDKITLKYIGPKLNLGQYEEYTGVKKKYLKGECIPANIYGADKKLIVTAGKLDKDEITLPTPSFVDSFTPGNGNIFYLYPTRDMKMDEFLRSVKAENAGANYTVMAAIYDTDTKLFNMTDNTYFATKDNKTGAPIAENIDVAVMKDKLIKKKSMVIFMQTAASVDVYGGIKQGDLNPLSAPYLCEAGKGGWYPVVADHPKNVVSKDGENCAGSLSSAWKMTSMTPVKFEKMDIENLPLEEISHHFFWFYFGEAPEIDKVPMLIPEIKQIQEKVSEVSKALNEVKLAQKALSDGYIKKTNSFVTGKDVTVAEQELKDLKKTFEDKLKVFQAVSDAAKDLLDQFNTKKDLIAKLDKTNKDALEVAVASKDGDVTKSVMVGEAVIEYEKAHSAVKAVKDLLDGNPSLGEGGNASLGKIAQIASGVYQVDVSELDALGLQAAVEEKYASINGEKEIIVKALEDLKLKAENEKALEVFEKKVSDALIYLPLDVDASPISANEGTVKENFILGNSDKEATKPVKANPRGMHFDGNQYMSQPEKKELSLKPLSEYDNTNFAVPSVTVSAFVKFDKIVAGKNQQLIARGDDNEQYYIDFIECTGNNNADEKCEAKVGEAPLEPQMRMRIGSKSAGAFSYYLSKSRLEAEKFYHLVFVMDGAKALAANKDRLKVYVNGLDEDGADGAGKANVWEKGFDSTHSPLYIGRNYDGSNMFNGIISELRIMSEALTENEAKMLYEKDAKNVDVTNIVVPEVVPSDLDYSKSVVFFAEGSAPGIKGSPTLKNGIKELNPAGLEFDGVDDFVEIPSPILPDSSGTVSFWIKPKELKTGMRLLGVPAGASSHTGVYAIDALSGPGSLSYWYGGAAGPWKKHTDNNVITANQLSHVIVVFDKETSKTSVYVDGVFKGIGDFAGPTLLQNMTSLVFGSKYGEYGEYFSGRLFNLRFFGEALSLLQAKKLYDDEEVSKTVFENATPVIQEPVIPEPVNDSGVVFEENFESVEKVAENGGTLKGNAKVNDGVLTLGGKGDYVTYGDLAAVDVPFEKIALSSWFKMNNPPDSESYSGFELLSKYVGTANLSFHVWLRKYSSLHTIPNRQTFETFFGTAKAVQAIKDSDFDKAVIAKEYSAMYTGGGSPPEFMDGKWHHLVSVYDGEKIYNYLDAKKQLGVRYQTGELSVNDAPFLIGDYGAGNTPQAFVGDIRKVKIYNKGLSDDDVLALYNAEKPEEAAPEAPQLTPAERDAQRIIDVKKIAEVLSATPWEEQTPLPHYQAPVKAGDPQSYCVNNTVFDKYLSNFVESTVPMDPNSPANITYSNSGHNCPGNYMYIRGDNFDGKDPYSFFVAAKVEETKNATNTPYATLHGYINLANDPAYDTLYAVKGTVKKPKPADWYVNAGDGEWNYRKKIAVNYDTKETVPLDNFPLLINLTGDEGIKVGALNSGNDIIFADKMGTKLDHEIESFDKASGNLVAWVKLPMLQKKSLQEDPAEEVYMYYGNTKDVDRQNVQGVWDANYKLVQHLNGSYSNGIAGVIDSSSVGINGTPSGITGDADGATNVLGKIGSAVKFDGVDDYINMTNNAALNITDAINVSAWVKFDDLDKNPQMIVSKTDGGGYQLGYLNNSLYAGKLAFMINVNGSYYNAGLDKSNFAVNTWYHVVGTYDGQNVKLYVNGEEKASTSIVGTIKPLPNTCVFVGHEPQGCAVGPNIAWPFDGSIDEVRISNVARSAAWIKAQYENQNNPAGFYTVGAEEK